MLTTQRLLEVGLTVGWMGAEGEGRRCSYWVGRWFAMIIELFWVIIDLLAALILGISIELRRTLLGYLRTI